MKILHINSFDVGGAAKACERLHQALCSRGIDSNLLSLINKRGDATEFTPFLESGRSILSQSIRSIKYRYYNIQQGLLLGNKPKGYELVSFPKTAFDITTHKLYKEADIIHLHWAAQFLDYYSFFKRNKKPIIWTLHDLNPLSGLFHYEDDLKRNFKSYHYLEREIKLQKINAMKEAKNMIFVAVSEWIHQKFRDSEIADSFHCVKISNGLDLKVYKPQDKLYLRKKFSLPLGKKIILFVAENVENQRKGFAFLLEALKKVNKENALLCILGKMENGINLDGFEVHNFGFVSEEEKMANIYGLADLFVTSSLEDNYPNTVLEALSAGVPVIGFEAGGIPEMVVKNQTGFLAPLKDVEQLATYINILLKKEDLVSVFSASSRKFAEENFNVNKMANEYHQLYKTVLNQG